ncbi:Peptidyl-tRNA hydrolase ICT1, mitochondrial [Trichinella spiralis]|uniref:Large ribosomal subunit protein mL62 n=1 Tax=Trichinella spiralis TaxID=6334 RepID=A0A0V1B7Q0_TRISP|nr:Peptidyl-tRNA hydrolase ICT1, mitochondrial [Trichinella spiralis]
MFLNLYFHNLENTVFFILIKYKILMYKILSKFFGNGRLFFLKSTSVSTFSGSYLCSGHVDQYFKRVICTAQEGTNLQNQPSHENGDESFSGFIPIKELEILHNPSSSPGGQNANRRNTRVEVRFHVSTAKWIPQKIRDQFMKDYYHKLTKNGILCVRSERTRSQFLNLADCLDKLRYSIRESEKKLNGKTPDAETLELIKWRQINAARKRVEAKRWRAQLKMTNDDY